MSSKLKPGTYCMHTSSNRVAVVLDDTWRTSLWVDGSWARGCIIPPSSLGPLDAEPEGVTPYPGCPFPDAWGDEPVEEPDDE